MDNERDMKSCYEKGAFEEFHNFQGVHIVCEIEETFVAMRKRNPAVESAAHNLEHRGLDRVRAHGFKRIVGLLIRRRREHLPMAA